MNIIKILLLFFLSSNLTLLFLLHKKFNEKLGNYLVILVSYGIGPLLNGLIFYYLILFFPKRAGLFYVEIISLFWIVILYYSIGKVQKIGVLYIEILTSCKNNLNKIKILFYFVILIFTFIFSVQALFYPIAEVDSAFYFAQSEAFQVSKNALWFHDGSVIINGTDEYAYNKMIRPGIPSFMAFSFEFGSRQDNYFLFNFFYVYYYYLLLSVLLFIVSRLSNALKRNNNLSKFFTLTFFIFYWNMTRFYIFNNKEIVIYFLTLVGLYLIHDLILSRKREIKEEILLGIIIGLNAFVNLHGIVIGVFLLAILFLFSKLSLGQKIYQCFSIFIIHLFFSAFEFFLAFGFIFLDTLNNFFQIFKGGNLGNVLPSNKDLTEKMGLQVQVSNWKDVYLRGKFQMITNPGSYGFYFLFFILIIVTKFREIISSTFSKIFLIFILIYYFVMIDPLNLNKNELAAVLWAGPKYSMSIVLFVLIFVSIYFEFIMKNIFDFIYKRILYFIIFFTLFILICLVFKVNIINYELMILLNSIQVTRDAGFYENKAELFYYAMLCFLILVWITMVLFFLKKDKKNIAFNFSLCLGVLFMVMPFFIVDVGKVPFVKTFSFLNSDNETKLKNIIYFGDLYNVYYYAKTILPKKTLVETRFIELYTYNDYFNIVTDPDSGAKYLFSNNCQENQGETMYKSGDFSLCFVDR